jgi:hypothetical protein
LTTFVRKVEADALLLCTCMRVRCSVCVRLSQRGVRERNVHVAKLSRPLSTQHRVSLSVLRQQRSVGASLRHVSLLRRRRHSAAVLQYSPTAIYLLTLLTFLLRCFLAVQCVTDVIRRLLRVSVSEPRVVCRVYKLRRGLSERLRRVFQLQRGPDGPQDVALLRHEGRSLEQDGQLRRQLLPRHLLLQRRLRLDRLRSVLPVSTCCLQ